MKTDSQQSQPFGKEEFEKELNKRKLTYAQVINGFNTSQRLEISIDFLERQNDNYNPIYELVLSYLRDVRDGSIPDYVMENHEHGN